MISLFLKAGKEWEELETCNKQVYGPKAYLGSFNTYNEEQRYSFTFQAFLASQRVYLQLTKHGLY